MSSALGKASERAGVAEKRVAQLDDELAKKSSVLANQVTIAFVIHNNCRAE